MQAVKPEWTSLQANFTSLALDGRLSCIIGELDALNQQMEARPTGVLDESSSLQFTLRKIQRYIEWTVPELLPDRAEEAATLVNVGRFAAGLRIQQGAWDTSRITTAIEQQIQWISAIRNPVS